MAIRGINTSECAENWREVRMVYTHKNPHPAPSVLLLLAIWFVVCGTACWSHISHMAQNEQVIGLLSSSRLSTVYTTQGTTFHTETSTPWYGIERQMTYYDLRLIKRIMNQF